MQYGLLGPFEATRDGRALELRATKVQTVLAMLVLRPNQIVFADQLIEGLWGERPPETASNTLQTYVSRLRKLLGPNVIQTRAGGYVLSVNPECIDSHRFQRLRNQGQEALRAGEPAAAATLLAGALGQWRGPALADFTYETFAQAEIARLEEARLATIEDLIEAELALGRHAEKVSELRDLVRQHPLRERLWGQLILALYRCGRRADALRTYAEVRELLGEELGLEPSRQLQLLEEAVLLQKAELDLSRSPDRASGPSPAEPISSGRLAHPRSPRRGSGRGEGCWRRPTRSRSPWRHRPGWG
jgi:DNA-binding SARP family transcriptional activator